MDRHAVASFARFVVCGGGVGLLSSGALLLMTGAMSIAVANAIVTVVSTVVANELHSRITFRHGAASVRVHLESTATAVAAYLVTTAALLALDAIDGGAGALTRQVVYLAASGLAGVGRFVALKVMVFARGTKSGQPQAASVPVPHAVHANTPAHVVAAA
ncbi:GtrA domain-containing protein [Streptodolium elevatio]|uniref:GtrA-like protein domain-containing protein n=1 Tax=Streptodolium elevatio TaxID=3157996 RepID=A0ABV3DH76_9ACTN